MPKKPLEYICDLHRHLVCKPYTIKNLHRMATELNIGRHWFHKTHYDIPKRRIYEVMTRCTVVPARVIVLIINDQKKQNSI